MDNFWKRLWTEINIDNLKYNFHNIKARLNDTTAICCVIKANAYGHHAPRIAACLEGEGADWFAVSNIEEAIQLRDAGISRPILILGYTPTECAELLSKNDISQCVYSYEYAKELSDKARESNSNVKIHVKIDTGMGRLGFQYDRGIELTDELVEVCRLPFISPEGVFTHFAISDMGDEGKAFTMAQHSRFISVVASLENLGITFKYKHCANSAAAIDYPEFQHDMVRVGIILYGLLPSDKIKNAPKLKPVMSLKTVVSYVKEVEAGTTVSYGCDFVADKKMTIATVPMGYADGFWRSNSKTDLKLSIRGKRAKIVGRICMDQLMLDVTDIDGVRAGDEVVVFGDGEHMNTADDFARANGTINYEIVCSVGRRVPRMFISGGERDGIHLGVLDITLE